MGTYESCSDQCPENTKDCVGRPSEDRSSVSYNMWKDKVEMKSRNFSIREKLREDAARRVGYDPEHYTRPFRGKSRDLKAVITAVRFKQIVLKHSSRRKNLFKEALLAHTMRRAEEDLMIRGRQRQLRRAQALAEEKAKQADPVSSRADVESMEDDALQSLEHFMQSLSSVTRS